MRGPADKALLVVVRAQEALDQVTVLVEALKGLTGEGDVQEVCEHADRDTFELYLVAVEAALALLRKRAAAGDRLLAVLKTVARPPEAPAAAPAPSAPPPAAAPSKRAVASAMVQRLEAAGVPVPPAVRQRLGALAGEMDARAAAPVRVLPPVAEDDEGEPPVFPPEEIDARVAAAMGVPRQP